MDMFMKGRVDGRMMDVITESQFTANPTVWQPNYVAILGGDGYVYPFRGRTDTRPGLYMTPNNPLLKYKAPSEEEIPDYTDANVINMGQKSNIKEIMEAQNQLNRQERTILTTADNIFKPTIKEDDAPEMQAMKEALIAKNCDIDKYEYRFGPNFQNDKRLFDRPSMTLGKIKTTCKALDIKATLTLEDTSPDVANPMGRVIQVDLTGGGDDE